MVRFAGKGILLDIEGTTSSLAFVRDVLFPFARRKLDEFLCKHWDDKLVAPACERIARDAGAASLAAWGGDRDNPDTLRRRVRDEVLRLMNEDAKTRGLKDLQGLIWREGYEAGELRSHVFAEVPPALAAWKEAGIDVRVFSSGSVAAQRLFFAHTIRGNLSAFFAGHYDTAVGPKHVPSSYAAIAADMRLAPSAILFLSDVEAELDAAASSGMQAALVLRPGNAPHSARPGHPCVENLEQIRVKP